jgi:predicted PurR-regulated permease PerM
MKSDITNNITEIDEQKRKILSDISNMRKSFNDHLDKIEKQTVEEMVAVEQNLQVQLKNVLVAMAMIISYAHNATRNVMNRAVEFVLIAMFVASVLYRYNRTG